MKLFDRLMYLRSQSLLLLDYWKILNIMATSLAKFRSVQPAFWAKMIIKTWVEWSSRIYLGKTTLQTGIVYVYEWQLKQEATLTHFKLQYIQMFSDGKKQLGLRKCHKPKYRIVGQWLEHTFTMK